eukprot:jgi/Phyca11/12814/fgenesh1_pg.PHYCAscaffold_1_\
MEYVILVEYIEVTMPLVFSKTLWYSSTGAVSHAKPRRTLGFSALSQLAFVLEKHASTVQMKIVTNFVYIMQTTLIHVAHDLERIDFIHGNPVQLTTNKITCILFFESREELAMYEVKGRNASNFRELKTFPFSIGIETGFMSKEYLVRCDLFTVPQLYVVSKNKSIVCHLTVFLLQTQIRSAIQQNDVEAVAKSA